MHFSKEVKLKENVLATQKQIFHLHSHNFLGIIGDEFDYISFLGIILQEF